MSTNEHEQIIQEGYQRMREILNKFVSDMNAVRPEGVGIDLDWPDLVMTHIKAKDVLRAAEQEPPVMTYQQAARSALDIQYASNLSGVVFEFARVMQVICDESHRSGKGSVWKTKHPIVTLFLLKLAEMNGCDSTLNPAYDPAEKLCERIAAGEIDAW